MLLLVCLILATAWALSPARHLVEIVLGLLPSGLFVVASGASQLFFEGWVALGVSLGGQLLACFLALSVGHRVRARRMREVIDAA